MTQKTNDKPKQQGSQGNQQKPGQRVQAGGRNSPAGGPEAFESDQPNQGRSGGHPGRQQDGSRTNQERTTQGGQQSGRSDPYPPVNPDRPMMAGGQQVGTGGAQAGVGRSGAKGVGGTGLEEEEE